MKLTQTFTLAAVVQFAKAAFALPAVYSVPMKDGASVSNASFALFDHSSDGKISVEFGLPQDLVGPNEEPVKLPLVSKTAAANGITTLNFSNGATSLACSSEATGLSCISKYMSDAAEIEDVKKFLTTKYANRPELLASKIGVAVAFSTDPVGVLKITCAHAGCRL